MDHCRLFLPLALLHMVKCLVDFVKTIMLSNQWVEILHGINKIKVEKFYRLEFDYISRLSRLNQLRYSISAFPSCTNWIELVIFVVTLDSNEQLILVRDRCLCLWYKIECFKFKIKTVLEPKLYASTSFAI